MVRQINNLITALVDKFYWCCKHQWCFREATYNYRCHIHYND